MPVTTVPLLPYALVTQEDIVRYMSITLPQPGDTEEMLKLHINSATRRVERFCRRPFLTRTLDQVHNGNGERRLWLQSRPIIDLVQLDFLDSDGESSSTFLSTDVIVDLARGIIQLKGGGRFDVGLQNWQVQYNASFATREDIPEEVRLAALMMIARSWRDMEQQRDEINIQNLGDGQSVIYNQDPMMPRVLGLLRPWVHHYMEGDV